MKELVIQTGIQVTDRRIDYVGLQLVIKSPQSPEVRSVGLSTASAVLEQTLFYFYRYPQLSPSLSI